MLAQALWLAVSVIGYYVGRLHEANSGPIHPEVKAEFLATAAEGVKDLHREAVRKALAAASQPAAK